MKVSFGCKRKPKCYSYSTHKLKFNIKILKLPKTNPENGIKLGLKDEFGDNFLDYHISDFGRNISGGQAQRCSLLKITSNIKPIIIIDEPSSALDQNTSLIFTELLLSKAKDSILIVITHSKEQADLFSSKLYL